MSAERLGGGHHGSVLYLGKFGRLVAVAFGQGPGIGAGEHGSGIEKHWRSALDRAISSFVVTRNEIDFVNRCRHTFTLLDDLEPSEFF